MSIKDILEKYYYISIEIIKNSNSNKEKQEKLTELIRNLINANVIFSIRCLSKILKISRKLISKIINYINYPFYIFLNFLKEEKRGRKKFEEQYPEIINQIKTICENTENVDKSLRNDTIYVDVSAPYIKKKLKEDYNYSEDNCPSENTIIRIMREKLYYKITKVKRNKVLKKIDETDEIFENVNIKKEELRNSNENVIGISIDDKVAKYIGLLSARGYSWLEKNALDHDTNPDYIVKPFGILDLKTNEPFVYCTTNNSTARFKVDCIEEYLISKLSENPNINKLLIFLDNGSENSSSRKLWKDQIIKLAIKYNITIELVYYPPYHSKYNKIEHYWGVLQRSWSALIITNLIKLINAINGTIWGGIASRGYLRTKEYEKGEKVDEILLNDLVDKCVSWENDSIKKWSLIITPSVI